MDRTPSILVVDDDPDIVVVMTASRHYDTDKLGVHAVLHKPFDIDKLVEVLRAAMKPN